MNRKAEGYSYIREHPMPAYIVFIREKTLDRLELETYWSKAPLTLEGWPIKVLAGYGRHITHEGPDVEGVVVAEFPSLEKARARSNGPAYQEATQRRFDSWLADMEYCDRF
jgi:uncharacterized protein (DUF1330 family)